MSDFISFDSVFVKHVANVDRIEIASFVPENGLRLFARRQLPRLISTTLAKLGCPTRQSDHGMHPSVIMHFLATFADALCWLFSLSRLLEIGNSIRTKSPSQQSAQINGDPVFNDLRLTYFRSQVKMFGILKKANTDGRSSHRRMLAKDKFSTKCVVFSGNSL